jgi:hypothetical protein
MRVGNPDERNHYFHGTFDEYYFLQGIGDRLFFLSDMVYAFNQDSHCEATPHVLSLMLYQIAEEIKKMVEGEELAEGPSEGEKRTEEKTMLEIDLGEAILVPSPERKNS